MGAGLEFLIIEFLIFCIKETSLSSNLIAPATGAGWFVITTDAVFLADITHLMKFVSLSDIFLSFPIGY